MTDINLLPESKRKGVNSTKLGKSVKSITKFAYVIFTLGLIFYIGSILYTETQKRVLSSRKTDLESEIKNYQSTEQKYVLLRDRIQKATYVFTAPSAYSAATLFQEIEQQIPDEIIILESNLKPEELVLTITTDGSKNIGNFIQTLSNSGKFQKIELLNAIYDVEQRYVVKIKMIPLKK